MRQDLIRLNMHRLQTLLNEHIMIKPQGRGRMDVRGRVRLREAKEKIENLQRKESLCGAWLPLRKWPHQ